MLTVTINGTTVATRQMTIRDVLTSQPNTASFMLVDPANEPVPGQAVTVTLTDTGSVLFGGIIVAAERFHPAPGTVAYAVQCADWQRLLERELVSAVYENMTCRAVITDMVSRFTDASLGFGTTHVQDGPVVDKVVFNYRPVGQCVRELAELVGYDWYVDPDREIHFFARESVSAPFALDESAMATKVDDVRISPDYSQVRNRVFVRGGYTLSDPFTETQVAAANQTVFKLGYKPHGLSVTVDGVAKTIGVEFLDDESTADYMMNYQESTVRCATGATPPGAGAVMAFTYSYEVPVIVLVQDHASQQAIAALEGGAGVYEHIVVDPTIRSKNEAYNRARAEIDQFAAPWITGSFTTCRHGFRAGQTLTVNIPGSRYNGNYQIRDVTTSLRGTVPEYGVTFATTAYDLVDLLDGLIRDQRRVQLREDEVVDLLEFADETVTLAEQHSVGLDGHPAQWNTRTWGAFTWA